MEQLKMYKLTAEPYEELTLPADFSFSNFKNCEADVRAWADCLRNGRLIGDDTPEDAFRGSILRIPEIDPERDIWFIDYKGEHVGTVCAFVTDNPKMGDMHMVGIREDFRGKGLAKYLSYITVKSLTERNTEYISLTTDEFRKAAVKSYMSAGFLPVEYDYGMQGRWEAILREYNVDSIRMLYEDATYYKTIYKDKTDPRVKIGVLGAGRGKTLMDYCEKSDNAVLVAVCDRDFSCLENIKEKYKDTITYYEDYDEFLKHDMDLVVLANYANEHAPFAIKALNAGINVLSELLPVQTMKEAVDLVEAVERSGKKYIYGENCCYMPAPKKMRKLFRKGRMGEFQYGEGEYLHNLENDWDQHSHCDPKHWRNTMSAFYYCTHATGPLIHISGLRPVSVTGFEAPYNKKMFRMGALGAPFGEEIITLENGAILKCIQGVGPSKDSLWYSCMGENGVLESVRNVSDKEGVLTLLMNCDEEEGSNKGDFKDDKTDDGLTPLAGTSDHGGGDYYLMYNACECVKGNKQADVIDVYEALDMFLPGIFAYFSVLEGNIPQAIPDLRNKTDREKWRNDTRCTDPAVAGCQLLPSCSKGNADIPESVFEKLRNKNKK
ncbi:MAG: GNAT family N-acetyltransferase [Clostridia bacterium]|nr:GNAT family N-acetyltransferase [Clostridia bacterium]